MVKIKDIYFSADKNSDIWKIEEDIKEQISIKEYVSDRKWRDFLDSIKHTLQTMSAKNIKTEDKKEERTYLQIYKTLESAKLSSEKEFHEEIDNLINEIPRDIVKNEQLKQLKFNVHDDVGSISQKSIEELFLDLLKIEYQLDGIIQEIEAERKRQEELLQEKKEAEVEEKKEEMQKDLNNVNSNVISHEKEVIDKVEEEWFMAGLMNTADVLEEAMNDSIVYDELLTYGIPNNELDIYRGDEVKKNQKGGNTRNKKNIESRREDRGLRL